MSRLTVALAQIDATVGDVERDSWRLSEIS
jgi:hypothetical protein